MTAQPFNLNTPVGGTYWNAALANGCAVADTTCLRNYIFSHFNGQPGVTQTGVGFDRATPTGTIVGQSGDPVTNFRINTPVNNRSASLHGFEFNVQNAFGNSGFGVGANYTLVAIGPEVRQLQHGRPVRAGGPEQLGQRRGVLRERAAERPRGVQLARPVPGVALRCSRPEPVYTEPYGQVDMTLGYNVNDHVSFSLDAINLNNGVMRQHSRAKNDLESITQTGRRYMIGARYKF